MANTRLTVLVDALTLSSMPLGATEVTRRPCDFAQDRTAAMSALLGPYAASNCLRLSHLP